MKVVNVMSECYCTAMQHHSCTERIETFVTTSCRSKIKHQTEGQCFVRLYLKETCSEIVIVVILLSVREILLTI